MKNKGHTYEIEGKATAADPYFEPVELLAIALGGAEEFLAEHPDIAEDKRAALQKMIAEERTRKTAELKTVMRRYSVALNQAKIFQARNQDEDYLVELTRQEPTVDAPGFIRLTAEDFHFRDAKLLKAISGASSVDIKTVEIELDDGFVYQPEFTLWFKV